MEDKTLLKATWFNSKIIRYGFILFVILYIGSVFFPRTQYVLDCIISPIVCGLAALGLSIINLPVTGSLPIEFYKNLVGICLIATLLYNFCSIIFMVKNKRVASAGCQKTQQQWLEKHECTESDAWIMAHALIYLMAGCYAMVATFLFFNLMFGWLVFDTDSYGLFKLGVAAVLSTQMTFGFSAMWSIVLECLVFDLSVVAKYLKLILGR